VMLQILKKENDTEFRASLVQAFGALAEHRVLKRSHIAAVRYKATTLLSQIQKEASYPELVSGVYLEKVKSLTILVKTMDKL